MAEGQYTEDICLDKLHLKQKKTNKARLCDKKFLRLILDTASLLSIKYFSFVYENISRRIVRSCRNCE
jgi:hypothetical protein